jgi:hypothetical protein
MASFVYFWIEGQMVLNSDVVHVRNVTIDPDNHRLVVYHEPFLGEYHAEFIFAGAPNGGLIEAPRAAGQTISDYANELAASFNAGNYNYILLVA